MSKLNIVLMLLLIGSALVLINTAYEARGLFTQIDRAQREERQLAADHQRLEADRQAQATNLRVEKVAHEKLRMRNATAGVTHFIDDTATAAPGAQR